MAYKGKQITNPISKQTIEFVTTAKDSRGKELEMIATWAPFSLKPSSHYHPCQEEFFRVIKGELTILLNKRKYILQEGESIHIPPATVHAMWNESGEETIVHWKVCPAYDTEYFLETGVGLATNGKVGSNGMPDLLQVALLAKKYKKEFRLQKPAYLIQSIVFCMLTPIARLRGKKAVYQQYID
jgi:quercetin dioxygenase-like cupin family protein